MSLTGFDRYLVKKLREVTRYYTTGTLRFAGFYDATVADSKCHVIFAVAGDFRLHYVQVYGGYQHRSWAIETRFGYELLELIPRADDIGELHDTLAQDMYYPTAFRLVPKIITGIVDTRLNDYVVLWEPEIDIDERGVLFIENKSSAITLHYAHAWVSLYTLYRRSYVTISIDTAHVKNIDRATAQDLAVKLDSIKNDVNAVTECDCVFLYTVGKDIAEARLQVFADRAKLYEEKIREIVSKYLTVV